MKTIAYNPKYRMLSILKDGYSVITFVGDIAEWKFFDALGSGENIHIVDGSFRMKLKSANITEFLNNMLTASTQKITIRKGNIL